MLGHDEETFGMEEERKSPSTFSKSPRVRLVIFEAL